MNNITFLNTSEGWESLHFGMIYVFMWLEEKLLEKKEIEKY